ncbi:hypothetical protein A2801_00555 [Candidatus Woesebacteria bacterium RIFCSPHIGHO2_01_FULL_41_10]|uniref:Uncharacterized protein n=1 Tax=Candidatus Woesebacteria bacterium RIFCSPHIGHO2_01_FULL_41_10 TaxID=1802500 RepID=A0A1F7YU07_9BACT|nr:MAG: hypothetical protein A2801_00555 [Candidatus Woesebacteria bacterium RIFCSPHIGHO2_01_FULL_41_10]
MAPYPIILLLTVLVSPLILFLASKQGKKVKSSLRLVFLVILVIQILLGFLNWENLQGAGRTGLELTISYPQSLLWLFFVIIASQIVLLLLNTRLTRLVITILNFINTVILFMGLIGLSNILGFQTVSLANIMAVFLVLVGNIVSLMLINKDRALLRKYFK